MKKSYTEKDIKTLDPFSHIRERPGMYIGDIGDGSEYHDCVYILLKEAVDNGIDEYIRGFGKQIDVTVDYGTGEVSVRDYGRGIPFGKVIDCMTKMNTGANFNTVDIQFSAGMNGVGMKAVNALSTFLTVRSVREGRYFQADFKAGVLASKNTGRCEESERDGTLVRYLPDAKCIKRFVMKEEHVVRRMQMYAYVNPGLKIVLNGQEIVKTEGLADLISESLKQPPLYRPFAFSSPNLSFIFTHSGRSGEEFYTFVNGQYTSDGGTHLVAFKEALTKALKDYSPKSRFDGDDVREGICACLTMRMRTPNFIGQTKIKLGNTDMRNVWVQEWKKYILQELHRAPEEADRLVAKVEEAARLHGQMSEIRKKVKKLSAASTLNIKKLEDCREHLRLDMKGNRKGWGEDTMIFLTEGDSAGGTVSRARDARYQAVYPLRGKVKNMTDADRNAIVDNAELYNMVRALGVQESLGKLRYGKIVFATDADVDGLHIRNLLIAFFMRFFRPLVADGRVFILETPLYRVRKAKGGGEMRVRYCYSEEECEAALAEMGKGAEQTRFKGLGEITPEDFTAFIDKDIRLLPVTCTNDTDPDKSLEFYMGDNTPARRDYIMRNLVCTENDIE